MRHYQKLQTIGTLAGGIVHEFNNLLTPIIGYSEFLKDQLGEDSGGVLTVSAVSLSEMTQPTGNAAEWVCVQVSDTGCGIPEDDLKHIFDPFFTTKAMGEGTGLGLSVVQDILISHGGHITADSTPGTGSRFTIWLPAAGSAEK